MTRQTDGQTDPDSREEQLHELLLQLVRAIGLLEPSSPHAGDPLTLSERFALSELAEHAPLVQQELADLLNLEKSTVSRLVAGLVKRGLVTRERKSDNQRFYQVRLTRHGRAVARQVAMGIRERHGEILGALTAGECAALTTGLTALLRELRRQHGSHDSRH
jgi:DNA-binding MarR family transcriptional regulator